MEKEIGAEVELHLPSDPLNDASLGEAEDTGKERHPKDKKCEKEDPPWRYRKVWILNREL